MTSRLAATVAAAALTGVSLLGMSAPALAQYSSTTSPGVSDSTVVPGQTITVTSGAGAFVPGESVDVRVLSAGFEQNVGRFTAVRDGSVTATFTLDPSARPGRFTAVLSGASNTVRVPFTVVGAAVASPGVRTGAGAAQGQLPRTGSDDLVALGLGGAAMVAAGAAVIVVARRRRELTPGSLA